MLGERRDYPGELHGSLEFVEGEGFEALEEHCRENYAALFDDRVHHRGNVDMGHVLNSVMFKSLDADTEIPPFESVDTSRDPADDARQWSTKTIRLGIALDKESTNALKASLEASDYTEDTRDVPGSDPLTLHAKRCIQYWARSLTDYEGVDQ